MQKILIFLISMAMAKSINAQAIKEISLYPTDSVPNSLKTTITERTIYVEDGTRRVYDVINPTITMYQPAKPNGMALIICPGGGYLRLSIDHEGVEVAQKLNEKGITAFVLKYRLPNDTIIKDKSLGPLQDVQQAIRIVRKNASQWGVDEKKVGVIGFSAGGHVASSAITHFDFIADTTIKDTISLRPDFAALIYPVISFNKTIAHKGSVEKLLGKRPSAKKIKFFSNELHVSKKTPPVFIIHAQDDKTVPVENSLRFYEACLKNKVPTEMHLYPKGGHGFGLKNLTTKDEWFDRLINWLNTLQ